jgi:predicted peroxiredoxin
LRIKKLTDELVFLYGWGPEEEGRLSSMLYLAETSSVLDNEASIFLFTDAAILSKKGILTKLSEEIETRFKKNLLDKRIRFYVCEEAARKRGITKETLEEGFVIAGYATFLDMALSAKTVITI